MNATECMVDQYGWKYGPWRPMTADEIAAAQLPRADIGCPYQTRDCIGRADSEAR